MTPTINKLFYSRFILLKALYNISEANGLLTYDLQSIAAHINVINGNFSKAFHWLLGERLIEQKGTGYHVNITHKGINAIEAAYLSPFMRTAVFPSLSELDIKE